MTVDDLREKKKYALKCADIMEGIDDEQASFHKGYARAITEILSDIEDGFIEMISND